MTLALVGMGMGCAEGLSEEAIKALSEADVVIGAARLLEAVPKTCPAKRQPLVLPEDIAVAIQSHPEWQNVCVALSGDVGFYSGATKLAALLKEHNPKMICGVSAPQALAARLARPWQDFKLVSAHGKGCDILAEVLNHPAVFFLTDSVTTPQAICQTLCEAGLQDAKVIVGENLMAEDERLFSGTADEFSTQSFAPLCVALVENHRTFKRNTISPGIADDAFIRGAVPMTKREVRVNILSLLNIKPTDVLYDIGAGTGSVAVEMALLAREGHVYAVECNEKACALIKTNRERFGAYNLNLIEGPAPLVLQALPPPQAAFIGGSKGQMRAIIELLLEKNRHVRVVAAAVTLETLHNAMEAMQALDLCDVKVCQIAVSTAEPVGKLHMLKAHTPVFLVSGGGADET